MKRIPGYLHSFCWGSNFVSVKVNESGLTLTNCNKGKKQKCNPMVTSTPQMHPEILSMKEEELVIRDSLESNTKSFHTFPPYSHITPLWDMFIRVRVYRCSAVLQPRPSPHCSSSIYWFYYQMSVSYICHTGMLCCKGIFLLLLLHILTVRKERMTEVILKTNILDKVLCPYHPEHKLHMK